MAVAELDDWRVIAAAIVPKGPPIGQGAVIGFHGTGGSFGMVWGSIAMP